MQYCFECGEEYDTNNGYGDFFEFCSKECLEKFSMHRLFGDLK